MNQKYNTCGHAKLVSDRNGKLTIVKCTLPKRHEEEEHTNEKGDRWRS